MTGSHLDTQPTGGKFDGAYGVMAGLEVVRTLNDLGYETEAPIEIVAWTNEEGSRFSPAMVGSGVFAGVFDLADGLARPDNVTGVTLGAELERIGFAGPEPVGGRPVAAYFEAHIEQGPILEAAGKPIGVVTGAQGQRWYEITVTGQEAHAGPTPMPRRRDALVGAARMIDAVNRIGHAHAPYACATVGFVQVSPNSRNTIPGRVFFTVDFRHPEDAVLSAMDASCGRPAPPPPRRSASRSRSRSSGIFRRPRSTPSSSPRCATPPRRRAIRIRTSSAAPGTTPSTWRASRPTAMVFVPCVGGISHNEIEDAKPEDLTAGCNVLLNAVLDRAKVTYRRPTEAFNEQHGIGIAGDFRGADTTFVVLLRLVKSCISLNIGRAWGVDDNAGLHHPMIHFGESHPVPEAFSLHSHSSSGRGASPDEGLTVPQSGRA